MSIFCRALFTSAGLLAAGSAMAGQPEPRPTLLAQAATSGPADADTENIFWQSIQNSTDPAMFQAYLDEVEKGTFRGVYKSLALIKLKALPPAADAASAPDAASVPDVAAAPDTAPPETTAAPVAETSDTPATPVPEAAAAAAPAPEAGAPLSAEEALVVEGCDRAAAQPLDPEKPANVPGLELAGVNPTAAITACLAAAKLPNAPRRTFFELGRAYERSENYREALVQYVKAGDLGHLRGLYNAGIVMLEGNRGIKRDYVLARGYLERALEGGLGDAGISMGFMFMTGKGVKRDRLKGFQYYVQAQQKGSIYADRRLADSYFDGWGVPRDRKKACVLYLQGGEAGDADAMKQHKRLCRYLYK